MKYFCIVIALLFFLLGVVNSLAGDMLSAIYNIGIAILQTLFFIAQTLEDHYEAQPDCRSYPKHVTKRTIKPHHSTQA
jgi:hypothetical protein